MEAIGTGVIGDALDPDGARAPVRQAIAEHGGVDVLVNNVGGTAGGNPDLFDGKDAAFEKTLLLNLTSGFWSTREALPSMRERGYGRIVNIGSGASRHAKHTMLHCGSLSSSKELDARMTSASSRVAAIRVSTCSPR